MADSLKKKILVIGNQGYVGSVLVERLKQKTGNEVIGFDSGIYAKLITSKSDPDKYLDKHYVQDVRNFDPEILKDVKAVVYLAAISNDPMGNKYADLTKEINYLSCIKIANFAKKFGVERFIFASSCSVYGFAGNDAKKEDDKLDPLTAYAKSKIDSEESLYKISNDKFKVICLRFATACGMSSRLRLDLVLNDFVANAILFNEINILSDGLAWRPLIDVKDMAKSIDWAIQVNDKKIDTNFLCLNTGSNSWNYKVIDLAKEVSRVIGPISIKVGSKKEIDKRSYKVDFTKFSKLASEINIDNNLDSTINNLAKGIKDIKFLDKNFRDSDFMRLNMLKKYMKDKN